MLSSRDYSVRRKLTLLILAVSSGTLLIASVAFVANHHADSRKAKASHLTALADILASNSSAAMSSDRRESAADLLASLADRPTVRYACLFDSDGQVFAAYRRDAEVRDPASVPDRMGHRYQRDGYLTVLSPVAEGDDVLGSVFIQATTNDLREQFHGDVAIAVAVFALSLVVVVLISVRLRRVVSDPILDLAATAGRVAERGDYSIRVEPRSADEIGSLYHQFNRMLQRIQYGEEELRHLTAIVETTSDLVGTLTPDGRMTYLNRAGRRLLGIEADKELGETTIGDVHPEWAHRIVLSTGIPAAAETGTWEGETAVLGPGGNEVPVSQVIMSHKSQEGELDCISTIIRDIAERKQTEEELQREKRFTEAILNGLPAVFYAFDKNLRLFRWNRNTEVVLGLSPEELSGLDVLSLISEKDRTKAAEAIQKAVTEGHAESEVHLVTSDGKETPYFCAAVRMEHVGETYLVGAGFDVSQRKQAENDRETLIVELEAKNAELEHFAYTVSHDLKTPLITIRGYLGALQQDLAEGNDEAVEEAFQRTGDAADKMNLLLGQVLELSRIGRVAQLPEDVEFSELVHEVMGLIEGALSAQDVEIQIAPELPVLHGDRLRLVEVVQNLMENAVKYMGDQPRPRIKIGARLDGDEVVCYVEDNGIGIDPRHHHRVFGLFDQLDQHVEGSGVGLALAKRIIEVHGGRLWVESKGPGHGSTFCFTIPPKPNEPEATPGNSAET